MSSMRSPAASDSSRFRRSGCNPYSARSRFIATTRSSILSVAAESDGTAIANANAIASIGRALTIGRAYNKIGLCLIALAVGDTALPLVIGANRDEDYERPTLPA